MSAATGHDNKRFPRERYISTDVEVLVSIGDWSDAELREELDRRQRLADGGPTTTSEELTIVAERDRIERIRGMVYAGQYERAAREFCDVIRDALGNAI